MPVSAGSIAHARARAQVASSTPSRSRKNRAGLAGEQRPGRGESGAGRPRQRAPVDDGAEAPVADQQVAAERGRRGSTRRGRATGRPPRPRASTARARSHVDRSPCSRIVARRPASAGSERHPRAVPVAAARRTGRPRAARRRTRPGRRPARARSALRRRGARRAATARPTTGTDSPRSGSPSATGSGTASGRYGASSGSQVASLDRLVDRPGDRGIRTSRSSPSRNSQWSVPNAVTGRSGRSAHCGNWPPPGGVPGRRRSGTSSACIARRCNPASPIPIDIIPP